MRRRDFHYDLPPELIAQRPLPERSGSRMLCLDGASGEMRDRRFEDLPALLRPGDLLVLNDTRVIPARLLGHKASGGRVEALIERVTGEREASVHLRVSKRPAMGSRLVFGGHEAEVLGREDALYRLRFDAPLGQVLSSEGHVPLPPYIRRADDEADARRYQTVYARRPGAVAAPTAGLHFTTGVLASIAAKGVATCRVTLHVGAGTFQPVRSERIDDHRLHREWLEVDPAACAAVASARERGGRVVAVGTTSVRALESAARQPGGFAPMQGETELFLFPGQPFKVVDALLTNFHLPESTLLMLVCAFAGYQPVMAAYHHAVTEAYRFFSYGDAMFVTADPQVRRESS